MPPDGYTLPDATRRDIRKQLIADAAPSVWGRTHLSQLVNHMSRKQTMEGKDGCYFYSF